jgi:phosphatidylinositol alpha-1,6-mannosyltransferase
MRTLVVTNDFPPRPGGIQAYVHSLAVRQPPDEIVVYAPRWKKAPDFDAQQPFLVVRHPGSLMLPVPDVLHRARDIARSEACDRVWFGAAAPLGLLTSGLRRNPGLEWAVASTHGHEVGWALLPGARQVLRRIGDVVDVITYLGAYTRKRLSPALGRHPVLARVPSGVDTAVFRPGAGGAEIRRRHGLESRPVIVCVSRLVERKGQDMLIRALPDIRRAVPGTALLIVGGGPYREKLKRLARDAGVEADVILTGSVPWTELPAHYDAGDVFAMPCRTRRAGLEVEGLGIVYLEASATGLPVVGGSSGGAPDAVLEGETGYVVDGRSQNEITWRVVELLRDSSLARRMGRQGRDWVEREWRWDILAGKLRSLLGKHVPHDTSGVA